MKKILFLLLLLPTVVFADEIKIVDTGVEVTKVNPTGTTITLPLTYQYFEDKISYCVEPGVQVGEIYEASEDFSTYMSEEKKKKLQLIHYYGYGSHPTLEYYMATQSLIWEEMGAFNISFQDQYTKEIISVENIKEQIVIQVNNHDQLPDYANKTYYRYVGEFFDLPYFDDRYESKQYLHEGYMFLTFTEMTKVFHFTQKTEDGISLLYQNGAHQKLATLYLSDDQKNSFDVTVIYIEKKGNIEVQKTGDKVVGIEDGNFLFEKKTVHSVYGIYAKENIVLKNGKIKYKKDKLVQKIETTEEYNLSNELYYGSYYIKELETEENFKLDEKIYDFIIDEDHKKITFSFENERKLSKLVISKKGEAIEKIENGKIIYKQNDLSGITFFLYAKEDIIEDGIVIIKKDTMITQRKTKNGVLVFDPLVFGDYYLVEENSQEYENIEPMSISITNEEENISVENYKKKGNLKIVKTNEEGKKLEGVVFQIYKDDILLGEVVTNEKGEIELNDLEIGIYKIKEIKTIEGYQIQDIDYMVEVKENKIASLNVINQKYVMPITSDIEFEGMMMGYAFLFLGIISYAFQKVF